MVENWVDGVIEGLPRGAVDAEGVRLLLELARDELGLTGPEELTPGLLRELLLEVFPESVVADREEVPSIIAAARVLFAHLEESGAETKALEAELDRLVPEFTEVIEDAEASEERAAAELITGMMLADGVQVDDEAAVEGWVREFEAMPEKDRLARTEEYLRAVEEQVVPPVRLASRSGLATTARESALTAQVRALAEWTGEGRALNEFGELTAEDAQQAVEALGLETPRRAPSVQDQEDLPELDRLWWAALDAEVIDDEDGTAAPGPALERLDGPDDEAALDVWLRVFEGVAVPQHDPEGGLDPVRLVQNELTGVLIHLYEQDEPSSGGELTETLVEHVLASYEVADASGHKDLTGAVAGALALELDDLEWWGVLAKRDDRYVLTPLGLWGVRELLLADGFVAPVVGELAEAPAAALVAGLAWHRHDTADEEIEGWLAGRDPREAAGDLLEVMRTQGPGARNLAAAVLHRLGPEAADVVREASEDRPVRPYAVLWLDRLAPDGEGLDRDEYLWLFVDTVAGMLETADPRDAVAAALADAPDGADLAGMVEEMWRADHPAVVEVLTALGDHHPDKPTAKAARTAAYKARSVRASS